MLRPIAAWVASVALLAAGTASAQEPTDDPALRQQQGDAEQQLQDARDLQDALEQLKRRVEELEATQFAPTTKLKGLASLVVGSNRFEGSDRPEVIKTRDQFGATTFNYDLKIYLDTSFTGEDLLRIRLRSGNFDRSSNSFYGAGPSKLSILETAFQDNPGPTSFR
jgi:hypothetical protein